MAATVNGEQPRRRSPLRRALVLVGVVLVVCCAGAAAAVFGIYRWYGSEAGPAQAVADRYLGDLETGNPSAAYALTCPDFKAHIDESTFVRVQKQTPQPRGHRVVGRSVATVNGQRSAIITVELTTASGDHTRASIPLAVIGGTWYVCSAAPVP
jgi:hypothetical protein